MGHAWPLETQGTREDEIWVLQHSEEMKEGLSEKAKDQLLTGRQLARRRRPTQPASHPAVTVSLFACFLVCFVYGHLRDRAPVLVALRACEICWSCLVCSQVQDPSLSIHQGLF